MSELLVKCEKELRNFSKLSKTEQVRTIKNCKKCLIKAISEIVRNCLLGNIPLEDCEKDQLKPYKKLLKIIGRKKNISLERKRKPIQRGSGIISFLIPIALASAKLFLDKIKLKNSK
jgi:ribosomal 50S subunit-associated protein YjgA (DUF615 family)